MTSAPFDPVLGLQFAYACASINAGDSDDKRRTMRLVDFDELSIGSDLCLVGRTRDEVLIGFRATINVGGWFSNFAARLIPATFCPGSVHTGFFQGFVQFWPWIREQVTKQMAGGALPVQIVGHSRGGAFAALCSSAMQSTGKYTLEPVYTFGCPRVGNGDFARACPPQYRVVHELDPVPLVPPALTSYHHTGTEEEIWDDGSRSEGGDLEISIAKLWAHAQNGLGGASDVIHEHEIDQYITALTQQARIAGRGAA